MGIEKKMVQKGGWMMMVVHGWMRRQAFSAWAWAMATGNLQELLG